MLNDSDEECKEKKAEETSLEKSDESQGGMQRGRTIHVGKHDPESRKHHNVSNP